MRNADLDVNMQEELKGAIESGDADKFAETMMQFGESIAQDLIAQAQAVGPIESKSEHELEKIGLRKLDSVEREYYAQVYEKNTFEDQDITFPRTIYDRVFEDLRAQHPLLGALQMVNTTGVTEWIFRTADAESAWWGPLCDSIKKQLENGFKKEDTGQFKLSAFIPMCKSMLVLAPEWLDRFVRELLMESMAMGLEKAAVDGDGKDGPIGMRKDLGGAVVEGVYPDKTAKKLDNLNPLTIGKEIMAPMVDGKIRTISDLAMIVHPTDYWNIIYPLTTQQDELTKNYHKTNMAWPFRVIQSTFVPEGEAIIGDLKNYWYGISAPTKIEYSDEYRFLEDDRVYIAKLLGNGKPMDNKSFYLFDISEIKTGYEEEGAIEP